MSDLMLKLERVKLFYEALHFEASAFEVLVPRLGRRKVAFLFRRQKITLLIVKGSFWKNLKKILFCHWSELPVLINLRELFNSTKDYH